MSDPWAEVATPFGASANADPGAGDGEATALPPAAGYPLALVLVAVTTTVGLVAEHLIASPSLALLFVLPVVIAATSFGWGPSLAAVVASVLAFDYFFTEPKFSLAIARASDVWAASLLLVTAAIVSAVAGQSRRRGLEARRAAARAEALQALAHLVLESRPRAEVAWAAAAALSRIFRAPAAIFMHREGSLELLATARAAEITDADEEAARGAVATRVPVRGGTYPYDQSGYDFWAVPAPAGGAYVLGVDFTKSKDGRPRSPERFVEVVGADLAAAA